MKISIIGSNNNDNLKKLIELARTNPEEVEVIFEEGVSTQKLVQNAVLEYDKKMKIPEELKRIKKRINYESV